MAKAVAKKETDNAKDKDVSIQEMIDNLKAQHAQFVNQSKEAEAMALKALGAIEVLTGINDNVKNGEA